MVAARSFFANVGSLTIFPYVEVERFHHALAFLAYVEACVKYFDCCSELAAAWACVPESSLSVPSVPPANVLSLPGAWLRPDCCSCWAWLLLFVATWAC